MFPPLRPQREQAVIPHHSQLGELHTHFNLVLSSLPQAKTCSLSKSSFLSAPVNLGPWADIEDPDFLQTRVFFLFLTLQLDKSGVFVCILWWFLVATAMATAKTMLKRLEQWQKVFWRVGYSKLAFEQHHTLSTLRIGSAEALPRLSLGERQRWYSSMIGGTQLSKLDNKAPRCWRMNACERASILQACCWRGCC